MFIPSLKVVFILAKRHTRRQNRWTIASILHGKIEHAQFTVQHGARLACKIAPQLLCNIATCSIPCKVLQEICCMQYCIVLLKLSQAINNLCLVFVRFSVENVVEYVN